jgi:hypothetical protein
MELKFRRKLSKNHLGHTYINVPMEIAKALNCDFIDLVVDGECVKIAPARE